MASLKKLARCLNDRLFYLDTVQHFLYLGANVVLLAVQVIYIIYFAGELNRHFCGEIITRFPPTTIIFFGILPLVSVILLVWLHLCTLESFHEPNNEDITIERLKDDREILRSLTKSFFVRNNSLCHRSLGTSILCGMALACFYIISTMLGYLRFGTDTPNGSQWELVAKLVAMESGVAILLYTVVKIIFDIDVSLYALGGRYVLPGEMDLVERKLFKPLRNILMRHSFRVALVAPEYSSFARAKQDPGGVYIGHATVEDLLENWPPNNTYKLRTMGKGYWSVCDRTDPSGLDLDAGNPPDEGKVF